MIASLEGRIWGGEMHKGGYIHVPQEEAEAILELLKEQEQEISRLKHHVDCDTAEKLPSGCVGYGRGLNDDEPCETCKACEKYNGYGEE